MQARNRSLRNRTTNQPSSLELCHLAHKLLAVMLLALLLTVFFLVHAAEKPRIACTSIMLSGQHDHQPQELAMGLYEEVRGLKATAEDNRPIFRFGARYLHYQAPLSGSKQGIYASRESGRWCIGKALVGMASCDLYMRSSASTPLTTPTSGVWHVKVTRGAAADVGTYVVALNVQADCHAFAPALPAAGSMAARALPTILDASQGHVFGSEAPAILQNSLQSRKWPVLAASCAALMLVLASWVSLSRQIAAVGHQIMDDCESTCITTTIENRE